MRSSIGERRTCGLCPRGEVIAEQKRKIKSACRSTVSRKMEEQYLPKESWRD